MSARIIDGKGIAQEIRAELAKKVAEMTTQGNQPGLAVVLVGDDPASAVYVRQKRRACEEIGIRSVIHRLPADISQQELLSLVEECNQDKSIHGILVQLPLPDGLNEEEVIEAISPAKDVDGFHPINVGRLQIGKGGSIPCTPAGVVELVAAPVRPLRVNTLW